MKELSLTKLSELKLRLEMLLANTTRQEGQGMVEYALILVLIAVVVIVILTVVGKQVNGTFSSIANGLSN